MSAVVQSENLTKTFLRRSGDVHAMQDVSLRLEAGEFVAIRGKSGCGKSTLMLALGGLQRPDAGHVRIAGEDLYAMPAERRAGFRSQHIGFVFQQFHLIPYLTVLENVLAAQLGAPQAAAGDSPATRATELLAQMGLSERMTHKPAELSTGECQRVAIARALLNRPELILADEPTGNLDEENTETVLTTLRRIASEGTCVLLVTHDAQCAAHVDRTLQMDAGQLRDEHVAAPN